MKNTLSNLIKESKRIANAIEHVDPTLTSNEKKETVGFDKYMDELYDYFGENSELDMGINISEAMYLKSPSSNEWRKYLNDFRKNIRTLEEK